MALAKLTLVLKAGDAEVGESEDPALWHYVLGVVQTGEKFVPPSNTRGATGKGDSLNDNPRDDHDANDDVDEAVQRLARALKVSVAELQGGLSPSREPPYLHLNAHCWESFKKNLPPRGPSAISAAGLAGTMLALWIKEAKIDGQATQALTAQVLGTIDQRDPNASRSIGNTRWLQARAGGSFVVNPAQISKAQEVVRAFCQNRAPGDS